MILNLTMTVQSAPGTPPAHVADVSIIIDQPRSVVGQGYLIECRDAAGRALQRAVSEGLTFKHEMRVDEEPDD